MKEKTEKNKISYLWFLPEIVFLLVAIIVTGCVGYFRGEDKYLLLQNLCLVGLSFSGFGLLVRKFFPVLRYEYEISISNLGRFWLVFGICFLLAIICGFLPNATWPFLPVFVLLSLFGCPVLGVTGGSILLLLSISLSGTGSVGIFFLYFVTGLVGIGTILPITQDIKIVKGIILSHLCLMALEFAVIVLSNEARLNFELIAFPLLNMVVSFLVVFFGIRIYISKILLRMRDRYLLLNDTEHPALLAMKERNKKDYKQSIHTSYFCERIGNLLHLNVDALKCSGLFHRLCPLGEEQRKIYMDDMAFPGEVREILTEYTDYLSTHNRNAIKQKESAVLLCSQTIIMALLSIFEKDNSANPNMDRIVDVTFARFDEIGAFSNCDISIKELLAMKKVFKEDKLYYDFLR